MDENVSSQVRAYIGEAALGYIEQANTELTAERSTLGISEARVKRRTPRSRPRSS